MGNEWEAVTTNVGADCVDCESEVVAAMYQCWTGHSKSELPPSIDGIDVEGSRLSTTVFKVEPDSLVQLGVQAKHPQSVPLTAVWAVTEDLYSSAIGGAFENTLPLLRGLWQGSNSSTTLGLSPVLNTSSLALGRSYRLYIF